MKTMTVAGVPFVINDAVPPHTVLLVPTPLPGEKREEYLTRLLTESATIINVNTDEERKGTE